MHLGFGLPMAGAWATPQNQLRVARAAEDLGYHSLWVFQRLLYALKPKNDYPPLPGQPWPKSFECVMDPVVSLIDAPQGKTRRPLMGSLDEIREDIQRYANAGLTELPKFQPVPPTIDRVLAQMEAFAPRG